MIIIILFILIWLCIAILTLEVEVIKKKLPIGIDDFKTLAKGKLIVLLGDIFVLREKFIK